MPPSFHDLLTSFHDTQTCVLMKTGTAPNHCFILTQSIGDPLTDIMGQNDDDPGDEEVFHDDLPARNALHIRQIETQGGD
jgi:hypothetical protein